MFRFVPRSDWHNGRGWDFQIWRLVSQAHYGGGHLNEISRVVKRLKPEDEESWYREWSDLGEQLRGMAANAAGGGHHLTAGARHLRASNYFRMADFFLRPDDPRKLDASRRSVAAFEAGIAAAQRPVATVRVPFENTDLKAYWCSPPAGTRAKGSSIVFIGGLDSTAEELYFTAYGLLERGYSLLIVEGPGQGAVLREQKLVARHDYETVGTAALEWIKGREKGSPEPVALIGISLSAVTTHYALPVSKRASTLS